MDHDRKPTFPQSGASIKNEQPHRDVRQGAGVTLHLTESDEAAEARSGDEAEMRMRQALGLFGTRSRHDGSSDQGPSGDRRGGNHMQTGARRHRFVQDGEVPVSVVRGRRDQQAGTPRHATGGNGAENSRAADDEIANERAGREHAERRLVEAQTQIHSLQTRIGMAELERDEANEALRLLRAERAAALIPTPAGARESRADAASRKADEIFGIRRTEPTDAGADDRSTGRPDTRTDDGDANDADIAVDAGGIGDARIDDGEDGVSFEQGSILRDVATRQDEQRGRVATMRRAGRDTQRRAAPENGAQPELPSLEPEPVKWWLP